jgi:hypothetical protein
MSVPPSPASSLLPSGGQPPPTPVSGTPQFSRAFENLVQSSDDTVGLLAYALYKQGIREEVKNGQTNHGPHRNPPPSTIDVYRQSAERRLQEFAAAAIDQARPQIVDARTIAALDEVKIEIVSCVNARTSTRSAIATNLIAWVISMALTILIITFIYLPNFLTDLADKAKVIYNQPPAQSQVQPPASQAPALSPPGPPGHN